MPNLGPYTGDPKKAYSYLYGPHWKSLKGYRVIEGKDRYNHRFGGNSWIVPKCGLCDEKIHQIFTFDLNDPRLENINANGLEELPLVSCLNCSTAWEPQVYRINPINRSIDFILQKDIQNWIQDDEDKLPVPLPEVKVMLVEMGDNDIPINRKHYTSAFESFGREYVCRLIGPPLFAQNPVDIECPVCKKNMTYIATIGSEDFENEKRLISGLDFQLGEMYLYFFLCKECLVIKTDCQST
ncbi:MAG: hypothetical protein AB9888_07915 [Bacteroidales bacterium]